MTAADISAIWITIQLAAATTLVLFLLGTPLAWWLAVTKRWFKAPIEAITAMPLVLPPTVLGFYLLIFLSPTSAAGSFLYELTGTRLTFSFAGLVVASVVYSLPFMVQPLQLAFERVHERNMEDSYSLGVSRWQAFVFAVLPQCRRGILTAGVLTFAHTVGEFGVVLMVGGNIPGETRVISIAIYEHVETIQYAQAHFLAGLLLLFSFVTLLSVFLLNRQFPMRAY